MQLLERGGVTDISVSQQLGDYTGSEILMWLQGMIVQGYRPIPKITTHELPGKERAHLLKIIELIESEHYAVNLDPEVSR